MDIYAPWLPESGYYVFHLLAWFLPIILLQWIGFHKILWANRKEIFITVFLVGSYLVLTDIVAIHYGVWFFDPSLILGFSPGGVPIEEWAFFFLTALLVAQSFILFLPARLRH